MVGFSSQICHSDDDDDGGLFAKQTLEATKISDRFIIKKWFFVN